MGKPTGFMEFDRVDDGASATSMSSSCKLEMIDFKTRAPDVWTVVFRFVTPVN